ncbi:MAG TPA: hypothetical protein VF530_18810 [Planctomycetota bacterium]
MNTARRLSAALVLASLVLACDDNGDGNVVGGGGGGGAPALTPADQPGVSPCPNQTILTDAAEFATFQAALLSGTFLYRDVPFNGADPDIFVKKCGLGAFWDPADNTDEIAPAMVPVTLSDLFVTGNAGICSTGFANFGADEGLPQAGIYRKEFKVTNGGVTYLVRVRVTVAGAFAGDTWTSLGIAVPADLENTLGYEVDGTAVLHDDVLTEISSAIASPDVTTTLEVFDTPGGTSLLTALIEVLCVEIL